MDLFLFLKKQLMFNTDFLQKEKEDDRRGYSSKQADKLFFGLQIYIYIYITSGDLTDPYLIHRAIIVWYKFGLPFVMFFVLGTSRWTMPLMPVLVMSSLTPHYNK